MTIKIAHLYYDLMNLYGENGNVRALVKHLNDMGANTEIHFLTINDKLNFNDYDIFYIGMGSEDSQKIVIKDILKYKNDIKKAIENDKYFLITGNAYEIFGKYIIDFNKEKIETLNIFDYYTEVSDIKNVSSQSNFRIVGECSGYTKFIKEKVIGFQNRKGFIFNNNSPLFKISYGTGNKIKDEYEGFHYKNFYATYFIGPLLIRNPFLTNYLCENIILNKDKKFKFKKTKESSEIKAYNAYLDNFPNM